MAAVIAIGCGWNPPENSVRFSGYTERFLSRLPKYPTQYTSGLETPRGEYNWSEIEKRGNEIDALWGSVKGLEQAAQWDKLRQTLSQYLQETIAAQKDEHLNVTDCQARRNSAQDRLGALTALAQGASGAEVQAYLAARDAFDHDKYDDTARLLGELNPPPGLADNAAYLRVAITYKRKEYAEAAALFEENRQRFPRSEKREANGFMFAQAATRASLPENSAGADTAERGEWLQKAARELQEIAQAKGRYADDAKGLLPSLWLQTGEQAKALAEYYRLLASPNSNTRIDAAQSIGLVRGDATGETLTQVENDLADEPAAAYAYAYHTLYNYLPQVGDYYEDGERYLYVSTSYNGEKLNELHAAKDRKQTGRQRIVDFATRLLRRYPNSPAGGGFALRVAMAQMELGQTGEARKLAQRALQMGVSGEERARAMFLRGVAEHRAKDHKAARRTLAALLQENLDAPTEERARRVLAMAAEDDGDLGAALEQYFALGYDSDAAYFVDVLMTPEQLADFIKKHPRHEKHEILLYSLGVRHLRAGRWEEARQTLRTVKTQAGYHEYYSSYSSGEANKDLKERTCWYDCDETPTLTAALILRDMKTADDLEQREKAVAAAANDEAKAEAIYQYASYQYEAGELAFYNPTIWQDTRYYLFASLDGNNGYRQPGEAEILRRHLLEHDTPARALPLYLQVAEQFPQSKAAPDALYTAALCDGKLSNYNDYWRGMYGQGLHAGPRLVSFQDVRNAYPKYRFPRGEEGWEPATRTVNGGPAREALPKPGPKPSRYAVWRTRTQRAQALLAENFNWFFGGWRGQVKPSLAGLWTGIIGWLVYLLTLLAAYAVARHALPLHRSLRAHRIRWPTRAGVWRRLRNLGAGLQAAWHCRQWLSITVGADTPPQSWLAVSAAEFGAARRWWAALPPTARRILGNVVATDALLGLLLLRLIGVL